jgi:hypothetical protein
MKNPFGNYVVQKALKLSSGYHKNKLTGIIKKHFEKLNDRKLINKWKDILASVSGNTLSLAHLNINKLSPTMNISPNNSFISSNSPHSPHSFYSNTSSGACQPRVMLSKYNFNNNKNDLGALGMQGNMGNMGNIGNIGNIGTLVNFGSYPQQNEALSVNNPNWNM